MLSTPSNPRCLPLWALQLQEQIIAATQATQVGTHAIKATKTGWNDYSISFKHPFPVTPVVTISISGKGDGFNSMSYIGIKTISSTGFTARIYDTATSANLTLNWIATLG